MLEKIADIEKALEANAYRSALALTLTLPDICGKLEYPNENNGGRYRKWIDKYYTPYHHPDYRNDSGNAKLHPDYMPRLDGEMCYKLRCAYLHSGNTKDHMPIDELSLRVNGASSYGVSWPNDDMSKMEKQIHLDVKSFCRDLLESVMYYYEENKEKYNFADASAPILDIQDWAERMAKNRKDKDLIVVKTKEQYHDLTLQFLISYSI